MLGFSSISELAFAQLPGAFVHPSAATATATLGSEGVTGDANITLTGNTATMSVGDESVIGKANISITGLSTTLSQGNVLIWGEIVPGVNPSPTTLYGIDTKLTREPRNLSSPSLLPPKLSNGFCEP